MTLIFLTIVLVLLGCATKQHTDNTQIANPASVFCEKNSGKLAIITAADGSQSGECTLADGTKCEEWAYYRGECPKKCGSCPQLASPSSDFCKDGKIVPSAPDECGCVGASTCEPVACTMDAKTCPDGSFVGRIAPNCEFAPCPVEKNVSAEKNYCTPESRKAKICKEVYIPVCAWYGQQIKCFKAPCAVTESNGCTACINPNVEYWTTGACPK